MIKERALLNSDIGSIHYAFALTGHACTVTGSNAIVYASAAMNARGPIPIPTARNVIAPLARISGH